MREHYFAYGSNRKRARLLERIPGALPLGRARLDGYRLACDKAGADGSGKANLHPSAEGCVWGALYALAPDDWPRLDAFEGRYVRIVVGVQWEGRPLAAQTYRSDALTDDARPFEAYHALLLEGAREHDLPPDYQAWLARLPCRTR